MGLGSVTAFLMKIGGTTERVVRPLVELMVSSPLGGFFLKSQAQESSPYHGKEEAYDPSAENTIPEVTPTADTTTLPSSISIDSMRPVEGTDVSSVDTDMTTTTKESSSLSPTAPAVELEVVPTTTTTSKHRRIQKNKTQKKK